MAKHILEYAAAHRESQVTHGVEHYRYISFDVFDTLLRRPVTQPEDIFELAARSLSGERELPFTPAQFRSARIQAQRQAGRAAAQAGREEATLEQIYACLPEEYAPYRARLSAGEIAMEKACCRADPVMYRVYRQCLDQGKHIYILCDMYLPHDVIAEMLHACGYTGYKRLYVSSQVGLRKGGGKLFAHMLKETGISSEKFLHIGDRFPADYLGAKANGIHAIYLAGTPSRTQFVPKAGGSGPDARAYAWLTHYLNTHIDPSWDVYKRFGFEVLGPLLYGFSTWLHEDATQRGIGHIYFLARDGHILQQAYETLYGEQCIEHHYLYASRQALQTASYVYLENSRQALEFLPKNILWGCREICERFGVDYRDGIAKWVDAGLGAEQRLWGSQLPKYAPFLRFFHAVQPQIRAHAQPAGANFLTYLEQLQVQGSIALVDIGWAGTMQCCLEQIIKAASLDIQIRGYYLGYDAAVYASRHLNAEGYIKTDVSPCLGFTGLFELMFSWAEGSTRTYTLLADGQAAPVLAPCEYEQPAHWAAVSAIQEGAMELLSQLRGLPVPIALPYQAAYAALRHIGRSPGRRELALFSHMPFASQGIHPLAAARGLPHYICHPSALIRDFSQRAWKIGFLNNLVPLPLPYWTLYRILRNETVSRFGKRLGNPLPNDMRGR